MSKHENPRLSVPYEDVTKPLDPKDFDIIKAASDERGGFDHGRTSDMRTYVGIDDTALEKMQNISGSEQDPAFGQEKPRVITGDDRNDAYLMIRRLDHLLRVTAL